MNVTHYKIDTSLTPGDRVVFDDYHGVSLIIEGGEYVLVDEKRDQRTNFRQNLDAATEEYRELTRYRELMAEGEYI